MSVGVGWVVKLAVGNEGETLLQYLFWTFYNQHRIVVFIICTLYIFSKM